MRISTLNADGFVGHPLSSSLTDHNNQIWFGQMSNGDYVIGLFNRGDNSIAYNVSFADLGIAGEWKVRDLWRHADEGTASSISATVAPHGCKIVRLSK